jgi:hypothetical protein
MVHLTLSIMRNFIRHVRCWRTMRASTATRSMAKRTQTQHPLRRPAVRKLTTGRCRGLLCLHVFVFSHHLLCFSPDHQMARGRKRDKLKQWLAGFSASKGEINPIPNGQRLDEVSNDAPNLNVTLQTDNNRPTPLTASSSIIPSTYLAPDTW